MEETLRQRFIRELEAMKSQAIEVVTVAIRLPSGAVETVTNISHTWDKANYYLNYYDEDFKLKSNPFIQIVGYMLV